MRLWGGRFAEENDQRVADFTRSIDLDRELAADDIAGLDRPCPRPRSRGPADRRRGRRAGRRPAGSGRARSPTGPSPGTRTSRTSTSTSRRPWPSASARSPGSCRPVARATTRSPPTFGCGCAGRSTGSTRRCSISSARSSASPSAKAPRSCPARPTSSRRSPCCSPITCWPTSRWPSATGTGWPMPGGGRTSRRSAPGRWPAPATRSIARRRRTSSASTGVTANSLDAVSDRDFVGRDRRGHRARDGPPEPAGRGDHVVVESAVRVHPGERRVLDRLVDHAEQEEPRPGRAGPRAGPPGSSGHRPGC